VPDAATGRFTVVVRDLAANPVPYATVQVDFSSCPDVVICADQLDPEVTVYGNGSLSKHAGSDGSVTLTILGRGTGAPPQCLASDCAIYGGGFLIGRPLVSTYDLDGSGGVGAGDLSVWLSDFGSGMYWSRSDYDGSGTVGAGDLSEWLAVFGAGTSAESCAAVRP